MPTFLKVYLCRLYFALGISVLPSASGEKRRSFSSNMSPFEPDDRENLFGHLLDTGLVSFNTGIQSPELVVHTDTAIVGREDSIAPREYFSPEPPQAILESNIDPLSMFLGVNTQDQKVISDGNRRLSVDVSCNDVNRDANGCRDAGKLWDEVENFRGRYKYALNEIYPSLGELMQRLKLRDRDIFRAKADQCSALVDLKRTEPLPPHVTSQYIMTLNGYMTEIVDVYVDSMIKDH